MIPADTRILIVDDEISNIDVLGSMLSAHCEVSVGLNAATALEVLENPATPIDLILLDVMMPAVSGYQFCRQLKATPEFKDIPVIFISALTETAEKLAGFDAGGVDFISKPFEPKEVFARVKTHLTLRNQLIELTEKNQALVDLNTQLSQQTSLRKTAESQCVELKQQLNVVTAKEAKKWGLKAFVGHSKAMQMLIEDIRLLQQAPKANALILGASGTGKELIARALHYGGTTANGPFIAVNCTAIPHDLADSAFFGHLKGAFTGAISNQNGFFTQADGGTLFLDEIGDMPYSLQAKLLRTLEQGTITPVGTTKEVSVNVRIIAATHANLNEKIAEKLFRQDLYFRLAGFIINVPTLNERQADIPDLINHFIEQYCDEMAILPVAVSAQAITLLSQHHYTGHIRELRNLIEYALIKSAGNTIQPQHFNLPAHTADNNQINPPFVQQPTTPIPMPLIDQSADEVTILNYLQHVDVINNLQCQQLINCSHQRASYLLKKLLKTGDIEKQGERRWAVYKLAH